MLFTNGTGTGKTFTGLGIVKRFDRQGKSNTLIVVPDDKIAADWIESGVPLGLDISKLKDTKDVGKGIVVATYANLGENDQLATREWDLVVADEAHTLMQSADGRETSYLSNLRAITLHPDGAYQRHTMLHREDIDKLRELTARISGNIKILNNPDTMDAMISSVREENQKLEADARKLSEKIRKTTEEVKTYVAERQGAARPRLVALSATPFAYEKTVDWANGYLFDYDEGRGDDRNGSRSYNEGSNREQFFMQHFGYRMRYNKLTEPDGTKVDRGLLQRQFNGWLKSKGSLSGRMLDVAADYDRRFVLVDSAIGNQIDDALNWLSESARNAAKDDRGFATLRDLIGEKFDYLSRRYLLEAIKATEAVPIVKEHMRLGRKVVVFHDYKKGGGFNPFRMERAQELPDATPEDLQRAQQYNAALRQFNAKFASLVNAPLGGLPSPVAVFKREFPGVLLINGDEKKSDLLKRYKHFQDDASGPQVMLVQSAKNKGWSGHDTTGKHPRVLINLGQPTAPTLAIQQEGRIYRTGQVSNAIMRYLNTGTNWEKWAFATTIASRASAAENLGMGELSRALKDSFISAFEESDAYPPGHEGEGTGGKERDKAQNNALTAYDRAKTFYWATQKKNSRTKAQEGVDYFATPEPVGFKMVGWLGLRGGEDALEPSAGHGAIARWLPDTASRTVIEPSPALRSRLAMVMNPADDRIIDGTFEDLAAANKFDGIVMNPPFGVGGKTAIEHLAKAATHLRDGGRIVALIPTGPAADKRFEKWLYEKQERQVKPIGTVMIDGKETPIYRGDTVTTSGFGAKSEMVAYAIEKPASMSAQYVRPKGGNLSNAINLTAVTAVSPTGPRTEQYSDADSLHLVAEVRLPQVTFERAGTAVATRIIVIDKHQDAARSQADRSHIDLAGIDDIRELFDRLENMELPARRMTAAQEAAAKAEQNGQPKSVAPVSTTPGDVAAQPAAGPETQLGTMIERNGRETVEHITQKGKKLRGIVANDITKEQAQEIDPYTFKKDGGWFIRERHVQASLGVGDASTMRSTPVGVTAESLPGIFSKRFPKLSAAVEEMLARGTLGKKGGLVVLDTNDEVEIAREYAERAGHSFDETVQFFESGDGQYINAFFDPVSGLTFLIGPNLTADSAPALVMHEAVHGQRREWVNAKALALIDGRGGETNPMLRAFLDRVAKRMELVDEAGNENEAASYIVELAVKEGRSGSGFSAAEGPMLAWIERNIGKPVADIVRDFVATVRAWALAHGVPLKSVTVDDLVAYAQAGVRKAAQGRVLTVQGDGAQRSMENRGSSGNVAGMADETNVAGKQAPTPAGDDQAGGDKFIAYSSDKADDYLDSVKDEAEESGKRVFFHVSPEKNISSIQDDGGQKADFGGLFALENYTPGQQDHYGKYLHEIKIEEDARIATEDDIRELLESGDYDDLLSGYSDDENDISDLRELVADGMSRFIGDEDAASLLSLDPNDAQWVAQTIRSKVAKDAGFAGLSEEDGTLIFTGDGVSVKLSRVQPDKTAKELNEPSASAGSDVQFSRSGTVRTATRAATDALAATFTAPGKLSWWHKTVGTMYNLAERSPYFAPVFRAAQGFIDDVSHYANDAAEQAPKLLPKLDNWRDIWKSPISAADNKAIAKPIFEGTLMWKRDENGRPVRVADDEADSAGIVWHDSELRSMFGLTDQQIRLYREFRAATNRSVDSMTRADMLRYGGKDAKPVRDAVMDARDLTAATSILRQHFRDLARDDPDRAELLTATIKGIEDRADRGKMLMGKGYAPLSRFGRYTVDVLKDGKREYFGLFETAREANQMAARMRREFGVGSVTQGMLSQEAFKLFAGVTPETLELFGNALGLDSTGDEARDKAFQEYLRLTKSNRSAMKRMIHRQGIAGYSEDVTRVLASFVYSNARQTAAGLNIGDLGEAVQAIPKEQGELKDVAFRLADYVKNPQEEAQAIRGLLFAQYLGGSIASAFVNMTQPAAVTFPWLSQFGGAKAAAAQLAKAAADMAKKRYEPDLAKALRLAEEDGTVSPQEVHQLMAQAQGSGALRAGDGTKQGEALALASNGLKRLAFAWGKVFGMAEQTNRRITFIAAYRTAVERDMDDPAKFARKAVQETQFVYSKASKMQWGRGAIGGTLMTFKTYSVAYLELLHRMATQGGPEGKRAALLALGVLMLMGGVGGLPFAGDAEDVAEALARMLGYNISVKKARQELLEDAFGRGIAGFIDKGITGLPGVPLDVSGRLGMGNLIPGTGLLQPKSSHTSDMLEIVGPAGDLTKRAFEGAGKLLQGDVAGAALQVAPTAVRNAAKGVDMAVTGMYRDAKGYKVLDTNFLEAALKAVGFQPQSVAAIQEANAEAQQAKNFYTLRAQEIRAKWAAGIFEQDQEKVQEARDEIADWNRKNPDQRMAISVPSVLKRVHEMRKSKDERIAATAPKAMRAQLKADFAKVREGV